LLAETPVDYLIIGHHGSKTSSSVAWLKLINPKFAIISGEIKGFNRFPNIETRNVLKAQNIPYFVTSETGDLWIK
jgi:competence protein ComEC